MALVKRQREHIKSSNFALPRKKKFPINTKKRAISAVAYADKGLQNGILTRQEHDIVIRKVHLKYKDIKITKE